MSILKKMTNDDLGKCTDTELDARLAKLRGEERIVNYVVRCLCVLVISGIALLIMDVKGVMGVAWGVTLVVTIGFFTPLLFCETVIADAIEIQMWRLLPVSESADSTCEEVLAMVNNSAGAKAYVAATTAFGRQLRMFDVAVVKDIYTQERMAGASDRRKMACMELHALSV